MNRFTSILLTLFCFGLISAQNTTPLWEKGAIPNFKKSKGKESIPPRDIIFIKNIQQPSIESFLPPKRNANGMGVLICPGGGYSGVAYDWEGTEVAKWLNSKGIAAFVLKYRMPQAESVRSAYKAPIQDAQRAIRYIRYHAEEFNLDKNKIGVIGFSAGGHLASTLGTHYTTSYYDVKDEIDNEKIRPDFMMLIYPVISMQKDITHLGSRKNLLGETPTEERIIEFSNEMQVTEDTPPTFILHAGNDHAVPVENSIRMYQALVQNKVKTTMHIFPTGGHGFGLGISNDESPDWTPLADTWLKKLNEILSIAK